MAFRLHPRLHRTGPRKKVPPLLLAAVGFVLGVILVLGGVLMTSRGSELDAMAANGLRVPGKVIGERTEKRTSRRNGRTRTSHDYFIKVSFQHPDGTHVSEEVEVERSVHARYSPASASRGVSATVVLDPSNPGIWMVEEQLDFQRGNAEAMALILPLVGLAFFALGVFGTIQHIRRKNAPPQPAAHPPYLQQGGQVPFPPAQPYAPRQPLRYPDPPGQPSRQADHVLYDARRDGRRI